MGHDQREYNAIRFGDDIRTLRNTLIDYREYQC